MVKKIIAFSLYGSNPMYTLGAIENAKLALEHYPGWFCRFYIGDDVPSDVVSILKSFSHVEVFLMDNKTICKRAYRFMTCSDDSVDIVIVRDTDSRLSLREKLAVDEWELSTANFHIMRDHPAHTVVIMAGMWGCKKNTLDIKTLVEQCPYISNEEYGTDQKFLAEYVYPLIKTNCLVHDEFYHTKGEINHKFPSQRNNWEFVGEVFDKNNNRNCEYMGLIQVSKTI